MARDRAIRHMPPEYVNILIRGPLLLAETLDSEGVTALSLAAVISS